MCKADKSFFIDHTAQRHAPQLKEINLLPVHLRNTMIRVGQADERNFFIVPVLFKGRWRIGTDGKYLGIAPDKSLMVIP